MSRFVLRFSVALTLCLALTASPAAASDWPTFRKDIRRSGITDEQLALPLTPVWTFQAPFPPKPAYAHGYPRSTNWEGGVEKRRIDFDRADSVVVAGGKTYFGSVGDGKIYCLDAASGKVLWTFMTGGPVRLAPTVADGRLYAGSDDGNVYCLDAGAGSLVWKFRAAPEDHRVIGNGYLISLWPVRTGVLVEKGIAYFGAGIFATEGVFLYAVDARTGRLIWKNDREGERRMAQICPQGYLLATAERLVVPMARLAPGIYDKKTGEFLFRLSVYYGGGTFAALRDDLLYTGWEGAHCFPIAGPVLPNNHGTSESLGSFPGGQLVVTADTVYSCGLPKGAGTSGAVSARKWAPGPGATEKDKRLGKKDLKGKTGAEWSNDFKKAESIILAGATIFAGGANEVVAIGAKSGKTLWTGKVSGTAMSLTVSGGRLYVSTDKGKIICFVGKGGAAKAAATKKPAVVVSPQAKRAADTILKLAPATKKGFALVYGVETGELALELARRTELKIYAVSPDAKKVAAARKLLDAAGVYGGRVVVQRWPLEKVPYTKYFANLVVSETAILTGKPAGSAGEALRMTTPVRGTVVIGAKEEASLKEWLAGTPMASADLVKNNGLWAVFARPALKGAKPWTHQYGVPGATGSSEDELVRAPFRVQWFGDPGPEHLVDRHYWAAAPLAYGGRLFVCSYKNVTAYDAYNGTVLWILPLENATRAHIADVPSNVAVGPDGYFVAVDDICYRLNPVTGAVLNKFKVPGAPDGKRRMWGYVGYTDGVLVASRTLGFLPMNKWRKSRGEAVGWWLCSDLLFGLDAKTGKLLWKHGAQWFRHNNVVLGGGAVFLSQPGGTPELHKAAVAETKPFIEKFPAESRKAVMTLYGGTKTKKGRGGPYVEIVSSLDLKTGKPNWQRVMDWTACGGGRGTLIYKNGILLQLSDVGGDKSYYGMQGGLWIGRSVAARTAKTGDLVWLKPLNYCARAIVIGETIYAEPWVYDLKTGDPKMVSHPITGRKVKRKWYRPHKGCGPYNASAHTIFFRSGSIGYHDLLRNEGTACFDSNRPNCWMNFISAEGLALWPTGDGGCRCSYAHQCSVALVHAEESRVYADFTSPGPLTPVKRLAVNLGGPGDRRDTGGQLWFAYPRREHFLGMGLPLEAEFYEGGKFDRRDSTWSVVAGTKTPWVYASRADGLKSLTVPLRNDTDGAGKYTVRLAFAAPSGDKPPKRVFDVKLQGKVVRKRLDIAAGGAGKAVLLQFEGIDVTDSLLIELVSSTPKAGAWPILCGVIVDLQK